MIENPKNLTEQLLNLSERVATEMRVLNRTKVSTINGQVPDSDGNVTIQTGGDTSNLVPKTGDRGVLAGFEKFSQQMDLNNEIGLEVTINENSNDVSLAVGSVVVENGNSSGFVKGLTGASSMPSDYFTWTKVAFIFTGAIVTLGNRWLWSNGEVPNLEAGGVLVCHWNADFGIASFISLGDEDFSDLLDAIINEEMGGA